MQINITDIFRIETMNSVYEIKVVDHNGEIVSSCKKMGSDSWHRQVKASGTTYLEKLTIGASFKVPGVVTTSVVQDYQHFVLSSEPKRTTMKGFFDGLVEEIKEQVNPRVQYHGEYLGMPGPDFDNGWTVIRAEDLEPKYSCADHHVCSPDKRNCEQYVMPEEEKGCQEPGCNYSSAYGPSHDGSRMCKSGSVASGGTRAHCACDYCY